MVHEKEFGKGASTCTGHQDQHNDNLKFLFSLLLCDFLMG